MTPRRLTVRDRDPDARATFSVEVYHGKVWITSIDYPFTCGAILETTQADALGNLIIQTAKKLLRVDALHTTSLTQLTRDAMEPGYTSSKPVSGEWPSW